MGSFSVTELEETLMTDDDERKREEKNLYGESGELPQEENGEENESESENENVQR